MLYQDGPLSLRVIRDAEMEVQLDWSFRNYLDLETRRAWINDRFSRHDREVYDAMEEGMEDDEEVDYDSGHPRLILELTVDRNEVLPQTFYHLMETRSPEHMTGRTLAVAFQDEEGVGPGVRRELFSLVGCLLSDPRHGLFESTCQGYYPSSMSHINPLHLDYFRFLGRLLGLALHDEVGSSHNCDEDDGSSSSSSSSNNNNNKKRWSWRIRLL